MSNGTDMLPPSTSRRRGFRFGLRWLVVAVAALALCLAFCSQLLIVQQRRSFLNTLRANPRVLDISVESDYLYGTERLEERGFSVPRIRRWLGDEGVLSVSMAGQPTEEEREKIGRILPEAVVRTGLLSGTGVGMF